MFKFIDLGIVDYQKAYQIQSQYFNQNIDRKQAGQPTQNTVLFVEHPHVYTLGKHGQRSNLLADEQQLKQIQATFVTTDRGGDITYHGPGQQVVYPVIDMDFFGILTKKYVWALEEVVIQLLREYEIAARRLEGAPGVWLYADGRKQPEKICAIGVKVSHNITMHGLALNVNTDLSYFDYINPCGFTDKGVTSIEKELGHKVDMQQIKDLLQKYFEKVFSQFIHTEADR